MEPPTTEARGVRADGAACSAVFKFCRYIDEEAAMAALRGLIDDKFGEGQ